MHQYHIFTYLSTTLAQRILLGNFRKYLQTHQGISSTCPENTKPFLSLFCAICRMWPVSKLCPHFVFKRPRLNQIWPNFVFTAGFSTAGWPQNTARLSLKESRRLTPFELPLAFASIIMSSSEPPELLLRDVLAVSSISLENDGVQNQNLKCLTSGNLWPSFETVCLTKKLLEKCQTKTEMSIIVCFSVTKDTLCPRPTQMPPIEEEAPVIEERAGGLLPS